MKKMPPKKDDKKLPAFTKSKATPRAKRVAKMEKTETKV